MLLLAGLTLVGAVLLVLALRPARRDLRLPREDVDLPDAPPPTIEATARESDRDDRP
jgi:hypothetical protein